MPIFGQLFFIILAIFFIINIILRKGHKKLPWFFAAMLLFPTIAKLSDTPPLYFPRIFTYVLFACMMFDKSWSRKFKNHPLKRSLVFLLVMFLIIGVFNENANLFMRLFKPLNFFLENFFVLFVTGYYIRDIGDLKVVYKTILKILFVFSIYGFINFITKENTFSKFVTDSFKGVDYSNIYMAGNDGRVRVSSFTYHPIYYGFILAVVLLVIVYLLSDSPTRRQKILLTFLFVLLLMNVFMTNSRTPLASLFLGATIWFMFMNGKSKLRIVAFSAILILLLLPVPQFTKIVNDTFDTFTSKGSDLEGSSVEMRLLQTEKSLELFQQSPISGNGFGYIIEVMGFSSDSKSKSDNDFFAFESYGYKLLIEQGLCGIVGTTIFFFAFFSFLMKARKYEDCKKMCYLSMGLLVMYLSFIFGTGDMETAHFFMSVMGINVQFIMLNKERFTDDWQINQLQENEEINIDSIIQV